MASTGRGQAKPASTASNGNKGNGSSKNKHDKKDAEKRKLQLEKLDLSGSFLLESDSDFDAEAKIEILRKNFESKLQSVSTQFENKLLLVTTELQAKVDTLHSVVKAKDEALGMLEREIGELKTTCSFLSDETATLKGQIKNNEISVETNSRKYNSIMEKTSDLEDRSRRNNLVFYNIAEPESPGRENCEEIITKIIENRSIFDNYEVPIDRAHRIGRKKEGPDAKPRPIIVRFTYYKDKEAIISNGRNFKNSGVAVSADYSKVTLGIHRDLIQQAKIAQGELDTQQGQQTAIVNYKVTYKRLVLTYTTNKSNPEAAKFTRSFSHQFISDNNKWYIPPVRNTYANATKGFGRS